MCEIINFLIVDDAGGISFEYSPVKRRLNMCYNNKGFTFIEIAIVTVIFAIITAIGTPSILEWRSHSKFRSALYFLKGDLHRARIEAMQRNSSVVIQFAGNSYTIFEDNGATPWIFDNGETVIVNRPIPSGIRISVPSSWTDNPSTTLIIEPDKATRFSWRGLPDFAFLAGNGDPIQLRSSNKTQDITLNRAGFIKCI